MTTGTKAHRARHAKGTSIVDLVKILRFTRKERSLPLLSAAAEELLDTHILVSQWYPFEAYMELMEIAFAILLQRNESYALEMGIAGGMVQLQGAHKVYVTIGDPQASVLALRHSWRTYYDFGEVTADAEDDHTVALTIKDYSDIIPVHAMMIAGWGVAAARVAGSPNASGEVFERPWKGAPNMRYRIRF